MRFVATASNAVTASEDILESHSVYSAFPELFLYSSADSLIKRQHRQIVVVDAELIMIYLPLLEFFMER